MALYPNNPDQTAHNQSLLSQGCYEACHYCLSLSSQFCTILISVQTEIKMRFCNHWNSRADNPRPHRAGFIRSQSSGEERMEWLACSPDLNRLTLVGSAWVCRSCQCDQHNQTDSLVRNAGRRIGCHPTRV